METFNKIVLVFWINKIQHEIVWHVQMNPTYDVLKFIDKKALDLQNDKKVSNVWVELYRDAMLLDVLKPKQTWGHK